MEEVEEVDSLECRFCNRSIMVEPGLELDEDACHPCLIAHLREENERLRRWLDMSVRDRLVEHLIDLAKRLEGKAVIRNPSTQEAMAEIIGASREAVSREMSKLRAEGLVIFEGSTGRRGPWRKSEIVLHASLLERLSQ